MTEQRERFEAWWITQPDTHISQLIRSAKGEYSVAAQFAWEGWEAAEAPLLERIAELETKLSVAQRLYEESCDKSYDFGAMQCRIAELEAAIDELAVSDLVKLRKFYTREGAINLMKLHWPELLAPDCTYCNDTGEDFNNEGGRIICHCKQQS